MNKIIWVKVKCDNYYRFITKLQYISVSILEIKYNKKTIYLKIYEVDYEKLNKYLVSYKFSKYKDTGFYNLKNIIKNNHIFFVVLVFGLVLYFFLTNIIVKINIVHENKQIRELIEDELSEYGIKVLTLKKSYKKLDKIKNEILDKYPDKLDWIEIETIGMTYNVKIEERIITDTSKDNKTCDLVAKKNGVVSNIKLYDGEIVVTLNDYVREGDTLISGKIMYNEVEKRNVCASGEVYAKVWYTVNISIPFKYEEYEETGKRKFNIVWSNKNNKKKIFKSRYENYNSEYKPILKVFDWSLYLESEYETLKIEKEYSQEEALNAALKKAEESVTKKLGDKDTIIDKKVLKKVVNDSTMDIEVFVIVEELISEEKITVAEDFNQGVE